MAQQVTAAAVHKAELEWRLEGFRDLMDASLRDLLHPTLHSNFFTAPKAPEIRWKLSLYPNGEVTKAGSVSLFVEQNCIVDGSASADILVAVKISFGSQLTRDFTKNLSGFSKGLGWGQFTKQETAKDNLETDGSLVVKVSVTWTAVLAPKGPADRPAPASFAAFFDQAAFSDFAVRIDGHTFSAHRLILSAHSSVFRAMLSHADTKEAKEGAVDVEGASEDAVRSLLQFIYVGQTPSLDRIPEELLALAERYDVAGLKWEAEEVLLGRLGPDDLCRLARLADDHGAARLFAACQDLLASGAALPEQEVEKLEREAPRVLCRLARPLLTTKAKKPRTDDSQTNKLR